MYYVMKEDLEQADNIRHATNIVDAHEWKDRFAIFPTRMGEYGCVWLTWFQQHKAYFGTGGYYTLYRRPAPNLPATLVANWCGGHD